MNGHYTPLFASIRHSTKLAALPDDACRLFYLLLLAQCDAWGRIDGRPAVLFAEVWPLLGKDVAETERCRNETAKVGLIEICELEGEVWVRVPDWEDKAGAIGKRDHRKASRWPDDGPLWPGLARTGPASSGVARSGPRARARSQPQPQPQPQPQQQPESSDHPPSGPLTLSREPSSSGDARQRRKPAESWEAVLGRPEYAALTSDHRFGDAWTLWIEHTRTAGSKAREPMGTVAAAILNTALREGTARFALAVEASIAGNWQGIHYPEARGTNGAQQLSKSDRNIAEIFAQSREIGARNGH